jgi:uncharacterized peroxidase-related enzyme
MPWIETIDYADADGDLRAAYDRYIAPGARVDNIMAMHSLRPHTMDGHMALYRQVLHSPANRLPKWFLETLGVWVSAINRCTYCVEHHFSGLKRALKDETRAAALRRAIEDRDIEAAPLDPAQKAALRYAEVLTRDPASLSAALVARMREAGLSDGEILEVNQVSAYFSYANRTVLGLGCSLEGDTV